MATKWKTTLTYVNGEPTYRRELVPADDPSIPREGEVWFNEEQRRDAQNQRSTACAAVAAKADTTAGATVLVDDAATNTASGGAEPASSPAPQQQNSQEQTHDPFRRGGLRTANSGALGKLRMANTGSIDKLRMEEAKQEVTMASESENDYYEEDDVEDDDAEEDDAEEDEVEEEARPWPVTRQTLRAIEEMSPPELEDLIENVEEHERWQELRAEAKLRVGQWLGAIKKAGAAPRCEFLKLNGVRCGSPAMKNQTLCYYHAEAQKHAAEESARNLEIVSLEDKISVQLAIVRVCNGLATKSIDDKTGRAIISALRLAHRNIGDETSLL